MKIDLVKDWGKNQITETTDISCLVEISQRFNVKSKPPKLPFDPHPSQARMQEEQHRYGQRSQQIHLNRLLIRFKNNLTSKVVAGARKSTYFDGPRYISREP